MISFKNIATVTKEHLDLAFPYSENIEIDATDLLLLPSLIDPHVHFRFPGETHKEEWKRAAFAAFASGITHVFDMPNNRPSITTIELVRDKKRSIEQMLEKERIPLKMDLYLGARAGQLQEISKAQGEVVGIKIFMGGSTGELLLDRYEDQKEAFQRAADVDLVVAVHAESEKILRQIKATYTDFSDIKSHSRLRDRLAAQRAVEDAIELAAQTNAKLYILHVSTREEIELIRSAKRSGLSILAEVTPHHLYLTEDDYEKWGTKLKVNPPVRTEEDREALWQAIQDGTIDTIGSDHAPHTLEEKNVAMLDAPSGIAGIEYTLPLLLHAFCNRALGFDRLIDLTRNRIAQFFQIEPPTDWVIVDPNQIDNIQDDTMYSKAGFSPYHGMQLQGWPQFTIASGKVIDLRRKNRAG